MRSTVTQFRKVTRNGVEYRFDPLTQDQCRINPARAKRVKQTGSDIGLSEIINKSRETCPFCPGRVEEKATEFSWKKGRIKLGETMISPNLYPFGENHAVGIISQAHFLDLDKFSPKMLEDNLIASKSYIRSVYEKDREALWPIYVWNYMPPSAGSIIHPHVQILVESEPLPTQAKLLKKGEEYFNHNGQIYWEELVEQERKLKGRFICDNDSLFVVASFAPRGFNEIQFIFEKASSLTELDERQIADCLVTESIPAMPVPLRGYAMYGSLVPCQKWLPKN